MAWEKDQALEHIDEARGVHVIVLRDKTSQPPAEHQLLIHIGHDSCPLCGHPVAKDNVGQIDPRAHTAAALGALQQSMDQIKEYGRKHRVPGKKP